MVKMIYKKNIVIYLTPREVLEEEGPVTLVNMVWGPPLQSNAVDLSYLKMPSSTFQCGKDHFVKKSELHTSLISLLLSY